MNTLKQLFFIIVLFVTISSCKDEIEIIPKPIERYVPDTSSFTKDSVYSSIEYLVSDTFNYFLVHKIVPVGNLFTIHGVTWKLDTAKVTYYRVLLEYNVISGYKKYNYFEDTILHLYPKFIDKVGNKYVYFEERKIEINYSEDLQDYTFKEKSTNLVTVQDISTHQVKTFSLSKLRTGVTVASVGNLVFFAGGLDTITKYSSDIVDVYNTTTDSWTTAHLSLPRYNIATTSAGDKVFFIGGNTGWVNDSVGNNGYTNRIDIYNALTGEWTIEHLPLQAQYLNMVAVSCNNKVYFADHDTFFIYDVKNSTWSVQKHLHFTYLGNVASSGNMIIVADGLVAIENSVLKLFNTITGETVEYPLNGAVLSMSVLGHMILISYYNGIHFDAYELK